jgi:uroporphyrinogen decarboxylase
MTKRERVEEAWRLGRPDRVPFVPAVYEHKARLIGRTPSAVCRDAGLLRAALARELELYDPDALTAGVDIYNVEAEALGCPVRFYEESNDVPAVEAPILDGPGGLERLGVPDPGRDGRMPLHVEAAGRLHREMGRDMIVRGGLSGPFSLACALAGTENVLVATVEEPEFVRRLLDLCGRVAVEYGRAFLATGAGIILFDSKASPGAASPRVFREFVLPVYRDLVMPALAEAGARARPLIIGGDTTPIVEDLLVSGATQLLCDAGSDLERFRTRCFEERMAVRVNVDARLVHRGTPEEVGAEARRLLRAAGDRPGLLFGCGVVAYDTDPANVIGVRPS